MGLLYNLIKRTIVSRKTADTGQFPVSQVSWSGKTADIEVIYPYGLAGNLPVGSLVLTFDVLGQEENKAGIGNTPKLRFKNLEEGEVAVGNPITGSVVKFLQNGDIDVTCSNNQNINITGDATITTGGNVNLNVSGNVEATVSGTLDATVTGNTTIDSPLVTVDGALRVTGEVTAFYGLVNEITFTDIKNTYNIHTHNENDSAPAPTNVPNQLIS